LRKRTVAACSEAGVEVVVCSEAGDEAAACSRAGIKGGRRRHNNV
jgi:predicted Fe-Mo cluster-binding NifX family protein